MSHSMLFNGTQTCYLTVDTSANPFNIGTGDFTISWFQKTSDLSSNPVYRIFSFGVYPTAGNAISFESSSNGSVYYWRNNSYVPALSFTFTNSKTNWIHFAICRVSGVTSIYVNGTMTRSTADTFNYTTLHNGYNMMIGGEPRNDDASFFPGRLYGFRVIKGLGLYRNNFTPQLPIEQPGTLLLLTGDNFSTPGNNTVTNYQNNVVLNSTDIPVADIESLYVEPSPPAPTSVPPSRRSLHSNNSMVYYKKGSLSSGSIGGKTNARAIMRRT